MKELKIFLMLFPLLLLFSLFTNEKTWGKNNETLKIGTIAPDWTLQSIKGEEINLRKLKNRQVFIFFSAIGCVACQIALPEVLEFAKEHNDILVIGIYARDNKADLIKYAKQKEIPFDILYNAKSVEEQYQITGTPTFILLNRNNKILYINNGYAKGLKNVWDIKFKNLPNLFYQQIEYDFY